MIPAEESRLLALIEAARARLGDSILADPGRLAAVLTDQAPDLRPLILAMAAAMASHAPARTRAAADPTMVAARLAAEIAAAGSIDPALAADGIQLSLHFGVVSAPLAVPTPQQVPVPVQAPVQLQAPTPASPPSGQPATRTMPRDQTEWVGLSAPVASGPQAAPTPAMPELPWWKNKFVLGGAVALAVLYVVFAGRMGETARPQAPPVGPAGNAVVPSLAIPPAALPVILPHALQSGANLGFIVAIPNGQLEGAVFVSGDGWQGGGRVAFGKPGASDPDSLSIQAPFQLHTTESGVTRVMQPRWIKDGASAGSICVVFWQAKGPDVQLRGSRLCLLETVDGDCRKVIGCAIVG